MWLVEVGLALKSSPGDGYGRWEKIAVIHNDNDYVYQAEEHAIIQVLKTRNQDVIEHIWCISSTRFPAEEVTIDESDYLFVLNLQEP